MNYVRLQGILGFQSVVYWPHPEQIAENLDWNGRNVSIIVVRWSFPKQIADINLIWILWRSRIPLGRRNRIYDRTLCLTNLVLMFRLNSWLNDEESAKEHKRKVKLFAMLCYWAVPVFLLPLTSFKISLLSIFSTKSCIFVEIVLLFFVSM